MKKRTIAALCLVLAAGIGSCNLDFSDVALPESATVKTQPGLYVPIGNISQRNGAKNIADYVSDSKIRQMMNVDRSGVKMYRYAKPGASVRTYLMHQQITPPRNLDLTAYIDGLNLGGRLPATGTGRYIEIPVSFAGVADWITTITNAKFTVKVTMNDSTGGPVEVRFRTTVDNTDAVNTETKPTAPVVEFISPTIPIFKPARDTVAIDVMVSINVPFTLQVEFDWATATVLYTPPAGTLGNLLSGRYAGLDLSELTTFLANGEFKKVTAYMYIDGLPGPATMNLTATPGGNLATNTPITLAPMPEGLPTLAAALPAGSVNGNSHTPDDPDGTIDLTALFNSGAPFTLDYAIDMPEAVITKGSSAVKTITADMVIELPLEFTISGTTPNPKYAGSHVPLQLQNVMPDMGTADIFGRTRPNDGSLLETIETITVRASNCKNTIISGGQGGITLGAYTPGAGRAGALGLRITDGQPAEDRFDGAYPVAPKFELLVQKDDLNDPNSSGTLRILPVEDAAITLDFFLELKATIPIDKTITF